MKKLKLNSIKPAVFILLFLLQSQVLFGMEAQKKNEEPFDITTKICELPVAIIVNHIIPFILPLDGQTLILRFLLKDIEKGDQKDGIHSRYAEYKTSIEKWLEVAHKRKRASIRLWRLTRNYTSEVHELYPQLKEVKKHSDEYKKMCAALAEEEIKNGADVNISLGIGYKSAFRTPLCCAAEAPYFNKYMLELLLKNDADIELCAPLIWAIDGRNFLAVQRLISAGANINTQQWGDSALYVSVQRLDTQPLEKDESSRKIFNLLLEKGADVNIQNEDGSTPLFAAARKGFSIDFCIDQVKALLAHGADVTKIDKYGRKAIDCLKMVVNSKMSRLQILVDLLEQAERNAGKKDEI